MIFDQVLHRGVNAYRCSAANLSGFQKANRIRYRLPVGHFPLGDLDVRWIEGYNGKKTEKRNLYHADRR
jgi:hypothetical protein